MNSFIDMMRNRKEAVMGPDKLAKINKRVTKENEKYMFNFKEGPKRRCSRCNISSTLI